jgi:hypothetical protein
MLGGGGYLSWEGLTGRSRRWTMCPYEAEREPAVVLRIASPPSSEAHLSKRARLMLLISRRTYWRDAHSVTVSLRTL